MSDCNCPKGECPGEDAAADFLSDLTKRYDQPRQCDEIRRKLNESSKEPECSRIHDAYPPACKSLFEEVLQEALERCR